MEYGYIRVSSRDRILTGSLMRFGDLILSIRIFILTGNPARILSGRHTKGS